jgi:hypothetical protein
MKRAARILFALTLLTSAAGASASINLDNYPLRVQIFKEHVGSEGFIDWGGYYPTGYHGYGEANVRDGNQVNAMKFVFECSDHFTSTDSDEAYPARWKKPGQEIELVALIVGTTNMHKCVMKTTLKDTVYVPIDGRLHLLTQEEYQQRLDNHAEKEASLAPTDSDPTHYALKLTILDIKWGGRHAGIYAGQGQGNINIDGTLHAVDFSAHCISQLATNPVGRYYRAKWNQPGSPDKMSVLLHNDEGAAATCSFTTHIQNDVYIRRSSGDLQAVTPEEYKNFEHAALALPGN